MSLTFGNIALAASLSVVLLSPCALAQSTSKPSVASSDNVFAISFDQGTLDEYVKALKTKRQEANIVIDAGLENLKLPRVVLPAVNLSQAVEWVAGTAAARERGVFVQAIKSGQPDANNAIFLFTTSPRSVTRPQTAPEDRQVRSFSLTDASLAPRSADQIRRAIENALVLHDPDAKQRLKYNAEADLLYLRGTQQEQAIVTNVIEAIRQGQRQAAMPQMRDDIERLKKQFEEFKTAPVKTGK